MPVNRKQFTDPESRLAAFWSDLDHRVGLHGARPTLIPILDADPAADEPGNFWAFDDGRLMFRGTDGVVHQYVPTDDADAWPDVPTKTTDPAASTGIDIYHHASSDELRVRRGNGTWARYAAVTPESSPESTPKTRKSTTDKPKQQQPTPKTHREPFDATWGATYCTTHGREDGRDLNYGHFPSSAHGQRRIMIGFNDSAIRDFLAGGRIVRVELHLLNTDSWRHGGVRIHFGGHNASGKPNDFSQVRRDVNSRLWPESGTGQDWRILDDWFGRALRDHDIAGLTIDQPNVASGYGEMRWDSVRLRLTVRK